MKKILVIDDEEWLREMVQMALEQRGYATVQAPDGAAGVEAARKQLPDLILCDVNMGQLNGYATLSALRDEPATATIPFILMTGQADNEGMRHGMELGADDYLPKPFTLDELYKSVDARFKKTEAVRVQAEQTLSSLRDNITMMLPHEFRTPLNGIVAFGEILAADAATLAPEEIAEMGQVIAQSGHALERLVETFLVYSQLELLQADPQKVSTLRGKHTPAPGSLIEQDARKKAEGAKRAADLQLQLAITPVPMSEEYFSKVVGELTHNAFKFSPPGTPVILELAATPEAVVFSVSDKGRGFSREEIAKVGAFMQFERKTHEQQGLGLGLTIARRLTELHGGTLIIESESGLGTKVTVKLPKAS
ncbi:MAG: hybrid sensor histidine kinase/response regulator [Verrucomicrobiota bacterium]|nr:hybrid sensor histidine kinase/response regulator [Verrucomicrobiota bacterium]MCC6822660.1 hybrid sensor histidine kinase/response regulator [Limisphaerales bacterium]